MTEDMQKGIQQNNKLPVIPESVQTIKATNKDMVLLFFRPAALQLLCVMIVENLFEMWPAVKSYLQSWLQHSTAKTKKV